MAQLKTKTQKTKVNSLTEILQAYIKKQALENSSIAVAASAGMDSTVLLDSLSNIHPANLISCLHLDHGIREDSNDAVLFLKDFCSKKNINFHHETLENQKEKDENSLRKARYDFFERNCKKLNTSDLFIAHNLNDDVETIIFRLFRGSSSFGLLGIPESRESAGIKIHRPFLDTSREEIEDYFKTHNLNCIQDSTNNDLNYARNLIRKEILPLGEKINPKLIENVHKLSEIVSEEQDLLSKLANEALSQLGNMPWALEDFRKIPRALQRQILSKTFSTKISFCDQFLEAVTEGGFHKINYEKDCFFLICKKAISKESI